MDDTRIDSVSNKIIFSRSNFTLYQRKLLGLIIETLSPYLFNEISAKYGKAIKYQLGVFNMSHIVYKASDICPPSEYGELRKALHDLKNRFYEIETDEIYLGSSLILKYEFNKRSEIVELGIDNKLYELALDLTDGYSLYQTNVLLSFTSIYAMRIYELLAKWRNKLSFQITIDELRQMTDTQSKYALTKDLKKYVLDVAKKQLDELDITDLRFDYQDIKKGRSIVGFKIKIIKTKHAHEQNQLTAKVSLHWDFSKDLIENFAKYNLVIKGRNLDLVKALKQAVGEQKLALEMDSIFEKSKIMKNPQGYMIKSLQNYLKNTQKEPAEMTPVERKQHAENARKGDTEGSPKAIGDLFANLKK